MRLSKDCDTEIKLGALTLPALCQQELNRLAVFLLIGLCHVPVIRAADKGRALEQRVDAIFAAYRNPESPGCALGIVQDGNFVYKRGYGMGSLELQSPLSPESVFYMGSVSKQFTAASVVLAAEQGYLSLDDNVRKWIPELPDYGHPITLRQMLHHTSGLRDEIGLLSIAGKPIEDIYTTRELIDLIARQKRLNFNPGDEYQYSNSNYFLLAQVVQRATGMRFSQFAAKNIFEKLGMAHTRFYDDRTLVLPGRVAAYSPREGGGFRVDWSTNFEKVGDGGLMSSVDDLLLWDRNFYHNQLGKDTLLRELQTRGVLNNGKTISYALGLELTTYRGLPVVEHGGAMFGYRTELLRFPEQKFSVICLCNLDTADPGAKAHAVADIYLAGQFRGSASTRGRAPVATERIQPVRLSAAEQRSYAGDYDSEELLTTYRIRSTGGKLTVQIGQDEPVTLQPSLRDEFRANLPGEFREPIVIHFKREDGKLTGFDVFAGAADGVRNIGFTRK